MKSNSGWFLFKRSLLNCAPNRMPDFTYKRKTPAAAASGTTSASSLKESEKPTENAVKSGSSPPTVSNFVRNGGKYATMVPVSKRRSGAAADDADDATAGEGEAERRHSDVDLPAATAAAAGPKAEVAAPFNFKETTNSNQNIERTDSNGCCEDDGICRPVDKNDVD